MRYWFDTEFLENGYDQPVRLLSIGIVAEDGREYYAQNVACPFSVANDWVQANVFPRLDHNALVYGKQCCSRPFGSLCPWKSREQLQREIYDFCATEIYHKPEFWAYYADYDWVVLCQLFGDMAHLPNGWPMYCRDIKQWCDDLGNPALPTQGKGEHNALADARWNRTAWEFLKAHEAATRSEQPMTIEQWLAYYGQQWDENETLRTAAEVLGWTRDRYLLALLKQEIAPEPSYTVATGTSRAFPGSST